jgi:hypothetical protein
MKLKEVRSEVRMGQRGSLDSTDEPPNLHAKQKKRQT